MSSQRSKGRPNSHDHNHHDHSRHHEHDHGPTTLTERDKLNKLIEHWIEHNLEHARSFEQWAERAQAIGEEQVSALLRQAAQDMIQLNRTFDQARSHLTP